MYEIKPLEWKRVGPGMWIAESERFNYRIVELGDGRYDVARWDYLWKYMERYLDCDVTMKQAKAAAEKHEREAALAKREEG